MVAVQPREKLSTRHCFSNSKPNDCHKLSWKRTGPKQPFRQNLILLAHKLRHNWNLLNSPVQMDRRISRKFWSGTFVYDETQFGVLQ